MVPPVLQVLWGGMVNWAADRAGLHGRRGTPGEGHVSGDADRELPF